MLREIETYDHLIEINSLIKKRIAENCDANHFSNGQISSEFL